ncbi:MAG: PD40 domain-containing protein [Anaerolineae bacterium]|nr:PD40 domain-containing protein [Anaerolineae bacterium]
MIRTRYIVFIIGILFVTSLACNAFAGNVKPEFELPPPTFVTTLTPATEATVPGAAPTVTLPGTGTQVAENTAVPITGPFATVLVDLNVRTGPGVQYDRVGFLLQGESVPIIGRDPLSGWWKIQCPVTITGPDCWISGGAQYAQASNTESVPVAAVPPTPTVPPTATPTPTLEPATQAAGGTGLLAYADNTGLWVVPLNLGQNPPTAGTPIQLATDADISQPIISPDGRKVAFLRGNNDSNVLGYMNTDGSGGDFLVTSRSVPNASGSSDVTVLLDQIVWLPDSQSLAFSSQLVNRVGPGAAPQSDLWIAPLNGSPQARFAAGQGGHRFNISPDGARVLFSLPESLVQVNMDGSNRQTVLTFAFVNTASEYAYVPVTQWVGNGNVAVTAVSGQDPWQANTSASLYRIANANALVQGSLPGNILFNPVQWSSDGSKLVYVRFVPDGTNQQTLILADSSGSSAQPYRTGQNLRSFGWNPANSQVLYAGEGFFGVGQAGINPMEVLIPVGLSDAQWLNNTAYVMSLGTGNVWNLTSGNLTGDTEIVATATGSVQFDVWSP